MFNPEQEEALNAPLNKSAVKQRQQGGGKVSYIEGWHAIAEANRIFGHGKWTREAVEMREVRTPEEVDGKWRVGFACKCRITVQGEGESVREGWGYGSGIAKDLGDAYESAIKEAETDAMKRALMTFGNSFGLALYDKDQRNVSDAPPRKTSAQAKRDGDYERCMELLNRCTTLPELKKAWSGIYNNELPRLPVSWGVEFEEAKDKRKADLSSNDNTAALATQKTLLESARTFCTSADAVDEFREVNHKQIDALPNNVRSLLENELEALRDNLQPAA